MAVSFGSMTIIWLAVKTLGSLFVMACALRAYLQAVRLHSQNPLSRLTFQMTDWAVLPIRRLVPGFGGVDWASVLASLLISIALATIFYLLTVWGPAPGFIRVDGQACSTLWLACAACRSLGQQMVSSVGRSYSDRECVDVLDQPNASDETRI